MKTTVTKLSLGQPKEFMQQLFAFEPGNNHVYDAFLEGFAYQKRKKRESCWMD